MLDWLSENYIEIFGMISGLIYIYFSIKQNILLWPLTILSSAIYIYVFFQARFYADMSLQVFFILISIYGWYYWINGNKNKTKNTLPISKTSLKQAIILLFITLLVFFVIAYLLTHFTNAQLPYADAITFTLSIVATWMLSQKLIEQWLIWIVTDLIYIGMYLNKQLYPTLILYSVFTILAVVGYFEWRKVLVNQKTV